MRLRGVGAGAMLMLSCGVASLAAQEPTPERPGLVRLGTFLIAPPSLEDARGWLGLYPVDSGFVLRPVHLSVQAVPNPCTGTATAIRAQEPDTPLFVVRARPGLRPGPVITHYRANEWRFIYPGEFVRTSGGVFQGFGAAEPMNQEALLQDYTLWLRQLDRAQVLARFDRLALDGLPAVLWSGDLDGDRRTDVFMSLKRHYASNHWALFLSSAAGPDSLVAKVAEFQVPGC